ncbi:MAG TPA: hypothetical protein VEH49_00550 [Methylomirabilota bacterium]|nr:hypothetical protein [Methylomirabilota bacterium]
MKGLVGVLIVLAISGLIYYAYIRQMPTPGEKTAPTQMASSIGVENDLLQIAHAEQGYVVEHEGCGSLDQLISSGAYTAERRGRDGYTYSVECSGAYFTVRARHPSAPEGSSIRYPNYSVDQTMRVREEY